MEQVLVDVSDFQGTIDFAAVKESGTVAGVVAKATDGLTFTASTFRRNRTVCYDRRIPFGAYHFFRMNDDGGTQARRFLAVAHPLGVITPMVDIEEASFDGCDLPLETKIERLSHFISAIEGAIKQRMLLYTNADTWTRFMGNTDAFCGRPLWVAQTLDPRTSGLFGGWKSAALWQDGTTTVPGIVGAVDCDKLLVPLSDLFLR